MDSLTDSLSSLKFANGSFPSLSKYRTASGCSLRISFCTSGGSLPPTTFENFIASETSLPDESATFCGDGAPDENNEAADVPHPVRRSVSAPMDDAMTSPATQHKYLCSSTLADVNPSHADTVVGSPQVPRNFVFDTPQITYKKNPTNVKEISPRPSSNSLLSQMTNDILALDQSSVPSLGQSTAPSLDQSLDYSFVSDDIAAAAAAAAGAPLFPPAGFKRARSGGFDGENGFSNRTKYDHHDTKTSVGNMVTDGVPMVYSNTMADDDQRDTKTSFNNTMTDDVKFTAEAYFGAASACSSSVCCSPDVVLHFPGRFSPREYSWHCRGKGKYTIFTCSDPRCGGTEYSYCPNSVNTSSLHVLEWKIKPIQKSNPPRSVPYLECALCKRQNKKNYSWTRCEEETCKAIYVFNHGGVNTHTREKHFQRVELKGMAKDLQSLRKLLDAEFLYKCANTRQVADKLHSVTAQLWEAHYFNKCWDQELMQRVSNQVLQSVQTTSAPTLSKRPASGPAAADGSPAQSMGTIVQQHCSACGKATTQRKCSYRTKCLKKGQSPAESSPKKPRRSKKKLKKPKQYDLYTCQSCGAEHSFCPNANHPREVNALLRWNLVTKKSKTLGTRKIMEMKCAHCKPKWTRCAEKSCKALYISTGGAKGNRSVQRHWETVHGISEPLKKILGCLVDQKLFTKSAPESKELFRAVITQLESAGFFANCANKKLMNAVRNQILTRRV